MREENVNEYGPLRGISVPGRGVAVSVPEWLRRSARWYADKEAVIDGARRFTYQQFNERVNRQANGLSARGIAKGERVAVVLRNSVEAMKSFGAAAKAGFVHVPINFRLSRREVGDILQHSGSRVFIVHREFASLLDLAAECPDLEHVIVVDDGEPGSDYERWLAEQSAQEPTADIAAEDNFFIVYTSGTTGAAKGAFYQHRQPAAHAPVPVLGYDMRHDSRILLVYPHNSIASLNVVYVPAWMLGATVVLTDVRAVFGRALARHGGAREGDSLPSRADHAVPRARASEGCARSICRACRRSATARRRCRRSASSACTRCSAACSCRPTA